MTVQEPKRVLRIGVYRGKQKLEERVLDKRQTVTIGQDEGNTFCILSSAVPKTWALLVHDPERDAYRLCVSKRMRGRVVVKRDQEVKLNEELKASRDVVFKGDEIFVNLTNQSRGRIVVGKITVFFEFVGKSDGQAVARMLYQRPSFGSTLMEFLSLPLAIGLVLALLLHLVPLLYVCLQDWPRNDEMILIPSWFKEVEVEEMQVMTEDEEEEQPPVVEESENVLPSTEFKNVEPSPDPGTVSRNELMDQITDKHREQGAMITAQILGVDGGVEGFYADMLGSNTHVADMSDIAAGDIGVSASGSLLNQLAAGDGGGSGGGLLGIDSGSGNSGPKVVVDSNAKKQQTQRAKVEFKISDKSDFVGAPPPGSKEAIEAVFRKKKGDIASCYQRVMNAQGKATGRFVIAITVTKDGTVLKVDKIEDQIGGEMFQCVRGRILNWKFGPLKAPISFKKTWVFS